MKTKKNYVILAFGILFGFTMVAIFMSPSRTGQVAVKQADQKRNVASEDSFEVTVKGYIDEDEIIAQITSMPNPEHHCAEIFEGYGFNRNEQYPGCKKSEHRDWGTCAAHLRTRTQNGLNSAPQERFAQFESVKNCDQIELKIKVSHCPTGGLETAPQFEFKEPKCVIN